MSASTPLSLRIDDAFKPTDRGVAGIVDDLLEFAGEQSLRLSWCEGHCLVETLAAHPSLIARIELPKSAFRAILARVATLCRETSGLATPYGGQAQITYGQPPVSLLASFANTPAEQFLELRPVSQSPTNGSRHAAPDAAAP